VRIRELKSFTEGIAFARPRLRNVATVLNDQRSKREIACLRQLPTRIGNDRIWRGQITTHGCGRSARSHYIFFVPTSARKSSVANAEAATKADFTRASVIEVSTDGVIRESRTRNYAPILHQLFYMRTCKS
jgi:hypothetical protein